MARNPIHHIAIDTSFIEAQNFLAGSKMSELSNLVKEGLVKLYLTDITYREILARFQKNIIQADEKIRKPKEQILSNAKVLRNFNEFHPYFNLRKIDIDDLSSKFKSLLDTWIENNMVVIISTSDITIGEVFDDYFNNRLPFKEGNKKHEFPDAFTLKALQEYFHKLKIKSHLLTFDNDLLPFISKWIKPIDDAGAFFDTIIRNSPEKLAKKAIQIIEEEFGISAIQIKNDTRQFLIELIEIEITSQGEIDDLQIGSVESVDIGNIEFGEMSIVYLNTNTLNATLECQVSFSFEASFEAHGLSEDIFYREDGKSADLDSQSFSISGSEKEIPVVLSCYFDFEKECATIEPTEINENYELGIFYSFEIQHN